MNQQLAFSDRLAGILADISSTVHTSASDLSRLTEDLKDMIDEFKVKRSGGRFGFFRRPIGKSKSDPKDIAVQPFRKNLAIVDTYFSAAYSFASS